jgi:hypothetical protein
MIRHPKSCKRQKYGRLRTSLFTSGKTLLMIILILFILIVSSCSSPTKMVVPIPSPEKRKATETKVIIPTTGSRISAVSTNSSSYPNGKIPRFNKFEITFQVTTSATNLQIPFDPASPPGVAGGKGVTVNAQFSPDNWKTIYSQPAFYYQFFDDQVKSGREWLYPNGNFTWKVRFAPNIPGAWQYKLNVQDVDGYSETAPATFSVISSTNKGFIQVSRRDSRYFEYQDGTYFPALEYNMNYDHISWTNPVLDNQANFQAMSKNGIQVARLWLSEWGIFGSSWNPWDSIDPKLSSQYVPYTGLTNAQTYPGSDFSMVIDAENNPCMVLGIGKPAPAVKRGTSYRILIRYKTVNLDGPRVVGKPFGFVAKTGGWLWDGDNCNDPGTGVLVTSKTPVPGSLQLSPSQSQPPVFGTGIIVMTLVPGF